MEKALIPASKPSQRQLGSNFAGRHAMDLGHGPEIIASSM
jgi:hypothetical protein